MTRRDKCHAMKERGIMLENSKTIVKRDGTKVPFEISKIESAIYKAAMAIGEAKVDTSKLALQVAKKLNGNSISVEEIQDAVEETLMDNKLAELAKTYILYRAERTKKRESSSDLMKKYHDLTFTDSKDSDNKRDNANIDTDTAMGTMLKYGTEGSKQFYLNSIIPPMFGDLHKNGDIHIHDMDFYALTTTCTQIDLLKLFKDGFCTGHGFLREPQGIRSYSSLACIAIQANQNDQHGGQSIPTFDFAMAEGVKKTFESRFNKNVLKFLKYTNIGEYSESTLGDPEWESLANDCIKLATEKTGRTVGMNQGEEFNLQIGKKLSLSQKLAEGTAYNIGKTIYQDSYRETERETYQAMEALIHNLNTMHSRAGSQVPFSSLNYGTDTSPEGRMVIRNVLLVTQAGIGKGETPIFPIQIFKVKDGVNYYPQDPNYDLYVLACKVSAKRLFPNFSFLDAPYNAEFYKEGDPNTEVAYMGCRTRVMANVFDKDEQTTSGRGNLSFTSINLPRLAIKSKGNVVKFMRSLDEMVDVVILQLVERMRIQGQRKVRNYPFLMGQGVWKGSDELRPDDAVQDVLRQGTLTVGFIGLAETLVALTGEHHGESEISHGLGLQIVKFMRDKLDAESQKRDLNFSLIATPAEGLSGRFIKMDRRVFGEIKGVTDREYYTNSFHVPVYYDISAFKKISIEAPYHELTNGGHISYVEMDGDPTNNIEAFMAVLKLMHDTNVGYGSINHPVDRDPVCGYTGIIGNECPRCNRTEGDQPFERIRRITGYLVGTLDRFNDAKKAEVADRVKHM